MISPSLPGSLISGADAQRMMAAGADALLVGTELMSEPGRLGEII